MQDIIDDIQLPKELLEKRCVDMTGEDIYNIVIAAINSTNTPMNEPQKPVRLLRGYKELAEFLHCSRATACRIVAKKDIHAPAIIRSGKTILFNTDLVLEQLSELNNIRFINQKNYGKDKENDIEVLGSFI